MATFNEFVNQFLSRHTRSTALYSLGWLIGLLAPSTISSFYFGCPPWIGGTFGVLTVVAVLAYLVAYGYFAYTDPDRLQTERWSLNKMAIERGFIGDDLTGYIRVTRTPYDILASPEDENRREDRADSRLTHTPLHDILPAPQEEQRREDKE